MGFEKGNKVGKQFTSENQPENRGRKGKTVSEFLREYGEGSRIEFEIVSYDSNNKKKTVKGSIESKEATINELIAVTIIKNALNGDNKAITTLLDRTEGKVPQNLNLGGQAENPEPMIFKVLKNNEQ
jgi:hypothetical protein